MEARQRYSSGVQKIILDQAAFFSGHKTRVPNTFDEDELKQYFALFDEEVCYLCEIWLSLKDCYQKRLAEKVLVSRYHKLLRKWRLLTPLQRSAFLKERCYTKLSLFLKTKAHVCPF